MKKILAIVTMAAMVAGAFAADIAARAVMKGNLAGNTADGAGFFKVNKEDQKDEDALVIQVNGDEAGAYFRGYYKYEGKGGNNGGELSFRDTRVWFKPVSMLKVTVGRMDGIGETFGEKLHWWKCPIGGSFLDSNDSWTAKYGKASDSQGIGLELSPIDGLNLAAVFGCLDGYWFDTASKNYGYLFASAKYNNIAGLPLAAGVSFRDDGKNAAKVISVGFDYGNAFAEGIYAMVNARMRLESNKLAGITIDNYFKFISGALTAHLRAPVTIRLGDDPSFLAFSGKVEYAMGGVNPYFLFGSDAVRNEKKDISFDDFAKTFNCTFQPGFTCNVGACAIDLGVQIDYVQYALDDNGKEKGRINWSIPFAASVSF